MRINFSEVRIRFYGVMGEDLARKRESFNGDGEGKRGCRKLKEMSIMFFHLFCLIL